MAARIYFLKCLILLGIPLAARGAVRTVELDVVNGNIAPDGFTRAATLVGGTFPGPLISGNQGDNFQITVNNQLHDLSLLRSTSVHWHGFFQKGANWADGSASVTQCPIAANHSFTYEINVTQQAGTFWYHSHLSTQYCDGLRGPFIIYDPEDPYRSQYDVDDQNTILQLGDWYHEVSSLETGVPIPNSQTYNGVGRYSGGPSVDLAVTTVQKGLRYRMRLLDMSCLSNYHFSIDGHNMTIIEVDGVLHKKLAVDSIFILAGQRYSFILNADQPVDNYWIRFAPDTGNTSFVDNINMAILRYVGAAVADPTTVQTPSINPLIEGNLVPYETPDVPGEPCQGCVDKAYVLNMEFNSADNTFAVNNVVFEPPTLPVLLQILSGTTDASDLIPSGSLYPLPQDSSIEISFPNNGVVGGPHPMHLHGHNFYVVRTANSTEYNYVDPPQRDVVSVGYAGDNVTIRFQTDNAGPWFLHCHIDYHLATGFAVVMVEDLPDIVTANPIPKPWNDLCPIYNNLTSSQLEIYT